MSPEEQAEAAIRDFRIRNPGHSDVPIQGVASGYGVRDFTVSLQREAHLMMGKVLDIRSVHSHSDAAVVLRIRLAKGSAL